MGNEKISLLDVKDMLPPGSSLAKFAQSTGLPLSKGVFPFGKWTADSTFLQERSLPLDPRDWWSSLTQSHPSEETVLEAVKDFADNGDSCVRDYLTRYLKSE